MLNKYNFFYSHVIPQFLDCEIFTLRLCRSNPGVHASTLPCLILILLHPSTALCFFIEAVIIFKYLFHVEIHVVRTELALPASFTQMTEKSQGTDGFHWLLTIKKDLNPYPQSKRCHISLPFLRVVKIGMNVAYIANINVCSIFHQNIVHFKNKYNTKY